MLIISFNVFTSSMWDNTFCWIDVSTSPWTIWCKTILSFYSQPHTWRPFPVATTRPSGGQNTTITPSTTPSTPSNPTAHPSSNYEIHATLISLAALVFIVIVFIIVFIFIRRQRSRRNNYAPINVRMSDLESAVWDNSFFFKTFNFSTKLSIIR